MATRAITVLASGRGSDLQSVLDSIAAGWIANARVGLVLSDDPDAFALERARRHDIPAEAVPAAPGRDGKAAQEARIAQLAAQHDADHLLLLAGYMRILSKDFVRAHPQRIINIHPALLPAFPGRDGPGDALRHGVRVAGCTTHFVDEGIDTGPIILQGAVRVHPDDDRDTLHARILRLEHQILPRTVDLWAQDRLRLDGRTVRIRPGDTWAEKVEPVEEAMYPHGF